MDLLQRELSRDLMQPIGCRWMIVRFIEDQMSNVEGAILQTTFRKPAIRTHCHTCSCLIPRMAPQTVERPRRLKSAAIVGVREARR
ncbi:hypothetical protein [Bosea sp. (in: a-proteobacteria)]|uniref:hypothetical protein n=1 Tax=Bosea sp. (in: a-proteobacteria) TaxID=1871050 RepID=UPI0025BAC665|nr:hypothetical protein [Bosea sp. (in: a-proteobacteria)]